MDNDQGIPQTSPLPQSLTDQPMQYLFWDAMKLIAEGLRITKLEWGNSDIYGAMVNGRLSIHLADGSTHDWILSDGDMAGDDYVIVEGEN